MKAQFSAIRLFILLVLTAMIGQAHAQSDVFVCVNENGTKEYKNTGATRGCKRVDLQGVSMIHSPYKKPLEQKASANPGTAASPADFPNIDSGTLKARDNDRLQVLVVEMICEVLKLSSLKAEFNYGDPERRGDERNF